MGIPVARWEDRAVLERREPSEDGTLIFTLRSENGNVVEFEAMDPDGDAPNWFDPQQGYLSRTSVEDADEATLSSARKFGWFCQQTIPEAFLSGDLPYGAPLFGLPLLVDRGDEIRTALGPGSEVDRLAREALSGATNLRDLARQISRKLDEAGLGIELLGDGWQIHAGGTPLQILPRGPKWSEGRQRFPDARWSILGPIPMMGGSEIVSAGKTPWEALEAARLMWPGHEAEWEERNLEPGELLLDVDVYRILGDWPPCWWRWARFAALEEG